MVDAIDLVLAPVGQERPVERYRRIEILAERLFNDDFPAARQLREAGRVEESVDGLKKLG